MAEQSSGYQPRNTPAERRAFFDLQKQLAEIRALIADLTARVEVLEP